jgi:DNA-directed RNA polymerase subunit beta'
VSLDAIKNLCYRYASQSGLTVSIDDVKTPKIKRDPRRHEAQADKVETQFRRGIITDGERRQKEVEIWTDATAEVQAGWRPALKAQRFNPIDMMVGSGARGNMMQVRQIAGMRGLVANPRGDMIPRPIKSNFREGLEMLEYFIATPGARKGLVDTALRTADSGLPHPSSRRRGPGAHHQREEDCGTILGVWIEDNVHPIRPTSAPTSRRSCSAGRWPSDVTLSRRDRPSRRARWSATTSSTRCATTRSTGSGCCRRSPTTRSSASAPMCYGRSLATGKSIELGEAVGVIAAQSIGEPGTQLTMRTFHTGGVAGKDIAGGLPRVVELFEARTPKGKAPSPASPAWCASATTRARASRSPWSIADDGSTRTPTRSLGARLEVVDGQEIKAGDPIVEGPATPRS